MCPELEKLGLKTQGTHPSTIHFFPISSDKFTNAVILELNSFREKNNSSLKYLLKWICQLTQQKIVDNKNVLLRLNKVVKAISKRKLILKKSENRNNELKTFLSEHFFFDVNHDGPNATTAISENHGKSNMEQPKPKPNRHNKKTKMSENRRLRLLVKIKDSQNSQQLQQLNVFRIENRSLKRKIMFLENKNKSLASKLKSEARLERKRLVGQIKYWTGKTENIQKQCETMLNENNEECDIAVEINKLESKLNSLTKQLDDSESEREKLSVRINELQDEVIDLTKPAGNGRYTYTPATDICIMELLDKHVPFEKVGTVIESVLKLCNLKPKDGNVPRKDYVSNVNCRKITISQAQVAETCSLAKDQTLYSDETRKHGQPYAAFITTDEDKRPYLMGLRQMSTKASQTQLDTFKDILNDIEKREKSLIENSEQNSVAFEIMKNITNTMSDRAATQFRFNELLETYRTSLLQEHVTHYAELNEEDQHRVSKMYNFFCGLHLLSNIADLTHAVFKRWESTVMPNDKLEHHDVSEIEESVVYRTIRTACKAFGPGADDKNGAYLEFKTYLNRVGVADTYQIKPFLGNRFNILFHNGGSVYHYRNHMINFLENVKSEGNENKLNKLLKSVLEDLRKLEVGQGLRALGILNKLVTTPLWKIMEDKNTHIMDMNEYYTSLISFLENVATNEDQTALFITGEIVPFPSIAIKKDTVWASLFTPSEHDKICISITMLLCTAMAKGIKDKVKDHLEGGKNANHSEEVTQKLNSVLPHNKLPEWAFGYLDWLLSHRPNATRLANEAHMVFHLNKTSDWMPRKSEQELNKLIQWSKTEVKNVAETEKARKCQLQAELARINKEKEEKANTIKEKSRLERETLTKEITRCGGLWDTVAAVKEQLSRRKYTKDRKEAIKNQIKFRQKVLTQKAPKHLYQISKYQGQTISLQQLQENLNQLIVLSNIGLLAEE